MPRGVRPMLLAAGTCAAMVACRPEAARIADAAERARPHMPRFERFDRWARRAASGEAAPGPRAALSELVFAPVRNASDVLAVWVELSGARAVVLALPHQAEPPSNAKWVVLRDPKLGQLQVAAETPCRLELPSWWRARPIGGCVFIAREHRASAARSLTVTMAFGESP